MNDDTYLLGAILRHIEDGITVQDASGRLIYVNDAGARSMGFSSADELLASPLESILANFQVFDEKGRMVDSAHLPGRQALAGAHVPVTLLRFQVVGTQEERWSEVHVRPVFDESGSVVRVINVFRDVTATKRAEQERDELLERERDARIRAEEAEHYLSFLAEASTALAGSLDYETTLAAVARLAVPGLADWCEVHIRTEDGTVRRLAIAHADPARVRYMQSLVERFPYDPDAPSGVPGVMRTGRPELVSTIPPGALEARAVDGEMRDIVKNLQFTSWLVVPLTARERVLGAIVMVSAESGRHYTEDDLERAQDLARRAAIAVDNAQLFRRAERTAAEQTAILEHMADGVVMVDSVGHAAYLNAAARRLTGVDSPSAGHEVTTALDESLQIALNRALEGETVVNVAISTGDDGVVLLRANATPIVTEDGSRLGAVAVLHDVTAERDLESQRTAFLSAAAHDLNTPLTVIRGLAQMLQRRLERGDTARIADGLNQINTATIRMSRLVGELLDISRIEMGGSLELQRNQTDLTRLLERIVTEHQQATSLHTIGIHTSETVEGMWDGERLERVFGNLLSNAIKYSPTGGSIVVRVQREDGPSGTEAVVTVQDEGMGIPADDLPRIFNGFFRAGNVLQDIPGTGIGLTGVKHIVEQHQGSISVRSSEGKGSTFTVRLPLMTEESRTIAAQ